MRSRASASLLGFGILAGAALKLQMLFHQGGVDMGAYYRWTKGVLNTGLTGYYPGVYYPLQMQLFEACGWIVAKFGIQFFVIFKLCNLLFDLGSLVLLCFLLKQQRANPAYALFYWIHPWFLTVFALGYVDFQFTFFVLLCLWLLRGGSTRDYLAAGLPLAAAFLMKPQTQILVVAVFFFGLFRYLRSRDLRPFGLLAGPSVLFVAYEIWFMISPARSRFPGLVLPASYLNVTNIMPTLTADMPNIWSPVAYLIKGPGETIVGVSDQIQVLPHVPIKYVAAFFVLSVVVLYVWRLERAANALPRQTFTRIFLFAELAVPFFMTSAHENHLFLATVLLVLFLAAGDLSLWTKFAIQILLLIQFSNIFSRYGEYPGWLAELLRPLDSDEGQVVCALLSLACFCFVAKPLWSRGVLLASRAA